MRWKSLGPAAIFTLLIQVASVCFLHRHTFTEILTTRSHRDVSPGTRSPDVWKTSWNHPVILLTCRKTKDVLTTVSKNSCPRNVRMACCWRKSQWWFFIKKLLLIPLSSDRLIDISIKNKISSKIMLYSHVIIMQKLFMHSMELEVHCRNFLFDSSDYSLGHLKKNAIHPATKFSKAVHSQLLFSPKIDRYYALIQILKLHSLRRVQFVWIPFLKECVTFRAANLITDNNMPLEHLSKNIGMFWQL